MTMLLLQIHEEARVESEPVGLGIKPSMKPSLFFTNRAILMALLQDA